MVERPGHRQAGLVGGRRRGQRRPALVERRRRRFFRELDEAYGRLLDDPAGRAAAEADRRHLDGTLADGLSADNGYEFDGSAWPP